jgi:protein ImuB
MTNGDFFSPPPRKRRILALFFPHLPTDLHRRRKGAAPAPLALYERVENALKIAALDKAGEAAGLHAGQPLAEARALLPALGVAPLDRAADKEGFARLLRALLRFSPLVAPARGTSRPAALLDIEGCARLFGGEARLAESALALLARNGIAASAAVASTPGCALALAMTGQALTLVPEGAEKTALAPLPVEALRIDLPTADMLRGLGLKTIGALGGRRRAGLSRRFGGSVLKRLDEAMGALFEPLAPIDPPSDFSLGLSLPEPVSGQDAALGLADRLAHGLAAKLEAAGVGARRFELALFRPDMSFIKTAIVLGSPTRAPEIILRLFRLKLDKAEEAHDPDFGFDFGFDGARLSAFALAPIAPLQRDALDHRAINQDRPMVRNMSGRAGFRKTGDSTFSPGALNAAPAPGASALTDLLVNHLGADAVFRLNAVAAHVPERAETRGPALEEPAPWADEYRLERPLCLLETPEPITAMALAPDGPPIAFRWRRVSYRVTRAAGPERILGEWRRGEDWLRDYYRIEDEEGRRYWIFREGMMGAGAEWRLHGFFA